MGVFLGQLRRGGTTRWPSEVTPRRPPIAGLRWLLPFLLAPSLCVAQPQQPVTSPSPPHAGQLPPAILGQATRPATVPQASQTQTQRGQQLEQPVISTGPGLKTS